MIRSALITASAALLLAACGGDSGNGTNAIGGDAVGGPDYSLEAISPEAKSLNVGVAGSDPADIARYLLARGASGVAVWARSWLIRMISCFSAWLTRWKKAIYERRSHKISS